MIEGFQDTIRQPGNTVKLMCKTVGGYPSPALTWYRNGLPHNFAFNTVEDPGIVKSEITVDIQASDNNAEYRCEAKNAALSKPKTAAVTFRVQCE